MPTIRITKDNVGISPTTSEENKAEIYNFVQTDVDGKDSAWQMRLNVLYRVKQEKDRIETINLTPNRKRSRFDIATQIAYAGKSKPDFIFPNYQDYGYGIFLLDEKSRTYVLANIQTEKDDFLRAMMWGALWDSVREGELNPQDYVELVIKNISVESDESTIQTILGRVSTAMNYYITEGGNPRVSKGVSSSAETHPHAKNTLTNVRVSASERDELAVQLETILIEKMQNAPTLGQRITFYRAFLNVASTENARTTLKHILNGDFGFGGGDTKMRRRC